RGRCGHPPQPTPPAATRCGGERECCRQKDEEGAEVNTCSGEQSQQCERSPARRFLPCPDEDRDASDREEDGPRVEDREPGVVDRLPPGCVQEGGEEGGKRTTRESFRDPVDKQHHRAVEKNLEPLNERVGLCSGHPPQAGENDGAPWHLVGDGV